MRAELIRSMILRVLAVGSLLVTGGFVIEERAVAGDPILVITGRVMDCSDDLSQVILNSAIPPSCTTDIIEAPVSAFEEVALPPETLTQTGGDGSYRMVVGNQNSTNILVGTSLSAGEAGFLSCIFQGQQGEYLGEVVLPLDGAGKADIRAGQPAWYLATCNFFLYSIPTTGSTFLAGILLCDQDLTNIEVLIPLGEKCSLVGSGLLTLLTLPDGTQLSQTSALDGGLEFEELQTGTNYTLTVNRPAFYNGTLLSCSELGADDQVLADDLRYFAGPDNSVTFSIQNPGANIFCSVLLFPAETVNEPGGDLVAVDSAKYSCAAGTFHEDVEGYWESCDFAPDGIQFDIFGTNSGVTATMSTGDIAEGVVIFGDLPADEWTIQERKPGGFGRPVVYCSLFDAAGNQLSEWSEVPVSDADSVTQQVEAGTALSCEWFNIAEDTGGISEIQPTPTPTERTESEPNDEQERTLTVQLLTCRENYNLFDENADPDQDCDEADSVIRFRAENADGPVDDDDTDRDGEVRLDLTDAEGDLFTILQEIPDEIATSAIWTCERNGESIDSLMMPMYVLTTDDIVQMRIEPGVEVDCLWLNVAEGADDDDGPGLPVSFTVKECEGVPNPLACDLAEGITVTLSNSETGQQFSLTSNGDGAATGNLPAGDYSIETDETLCFVDSKQMTDEGVLEVEGGASIDVMLFICT